MEDILGVDVGEGRALATAGLVRVAFAALGTCAHHEVRLGARQHGDEDNNEGESETEDADQLFWAHSVIH